MTLENLTQLVIGGVAIGAMVIIVKYFMAIVKNFIEFISLQEKNFTKILGNHINHSTEAIQNNEKATLKLINAIDKLTNKIEK